MNSQINKIEPSEQAKTYLIYLIGKSGVGKYSTAQALEKQGFILCDNQLINYPVFALLKYDGLVFNNAYLMAWYTSPICWQITQNACSQKGGCYLRLCR